MNARWACALRAGVEVYMRHQGSTDPWMGHAQREAQAAVTAAGFPRLTQRERRILGPAVLRQAERLSSAR